MYVCNALVFNISIICGFFDDFSGWVDFVPVTSQLQLLVVDGMTDSLHMCFYWLCITDISIHFGTSSVRAFNQAAAFNIQKDQSLVWSFLNTVTSQHQIVGIPNNCSGLVVAGSKL